MKTRSLAYLAAVSLGLLLLAVFDPWQSHRAVPTDRLVSASHLATLTKLHLVQPSGSSLSIQKTDQGEWTLVGEQEGFLDPNAVRELISVIGFLRSSREGPPAAASAEGTHSIHVEWQGGGQTFEFGGATADAKHRWVLAGDKAFLVESYLVAQLIGLRSVLVSRRLIAARPSGNAPLELRRDDSWVRVEAGKVQWKGLDYAAAAGPASVAQLRDKIAGLEFLEELPSKVRCDEASAQLRVSAGDAVLAIDECGRCSEARVGLRLGARSGCVDEALWEHIAKALVEPVRLVDRSILPTREAEGAFTLACGKGSIQIEPLEVDDRRLQSWWRSLDNAAVTVREGTPPAALCTLRGDDLELSFGKVDTVWLAFAPGTGLLWELGPEAATLLRATRTDFLSLDLIQEEPLSATRIVIGEGSSTVVLSRGELASVWQAQGGPGLPATAMASQLNVSQWALGLRAALSTLRAVNFADARSLPKQSAGYRRIVIEYHLPTSEGTKSYEVLVAPARNQEGQCWVQVDSLPPAWVSADVCKALLSDAR